MKLITREFEWKFHGKNEKKTEEKLLYDCTNVFYLLCNNKKKNFVKRMQAQTCTGMHLFVNNSEERKSRVG